MFGAAEVKTDRGGIQNEKISMEIYKKIRKYECY